MLMMGGTTLLELQRTKQENQRLQWQIIMPKQFVEKGLCLILNEDHI